MSLTEQINSSDNLELLRKAIFAQQLDHSMSGSVGRDHRVFSGKSAEFVYDGTLPSGIEKVGRYEASDLIPGEPYIRMETPLQEQLIERALTESFGPNSRFIIDDDITSYKVVSMHLGSPIVLAIMPDIDGKGQINFYSFGTNGELSEHEEQLAQGVAKYLDMVQQQSRKAAE